MRGFIISTHQLYAASIGLMADRRPKQLVMPAGVVTRALVEVLGNLMAILDAPDTAPALYLKDDYRNTIRKARYFETRYQRKPSAKDRRILDRYARELKLTAEQIADPEKRLKEWPTPGKLLKMGWLKGERRKVFAEIHGFWYGSLSGMAHQRLTALQIAVFTEDQPDEQVFLMTKSVTAGLVVSVTLCVLSEIEAFLQLQPNHHLRVAWGQVVDAHDLIQTIHRIRYGQLLERATHE
jgi:hypothetical protein